MNLSRISQRNKSIYFLTVLWTFPCLVLISGGSRISQMGYNSKGAALTYYFGHFFPKNCMNLTKIDIEGRASPMTPSHPLGSANIIYAMLFKIIYKT